MKEKIYTIPVMEAFGEDCECPVCLLEKKLEEDRIEYVLGPSLMEPDSRIETNEKGFCRRHFESLYNKQENRLGFGLIIDTHMVENTARLKKMFSRSGGTLEKDSSNIVKSLMSKLAASTSDTSRFIDDVTGYLTALEKKCVICEHMDYHMTRYIDVILYLWDHESEFKDLFNSKKGFCMLHFRSLLEGAKKHLSGDNQTEFVNRLVRMQIENLERVQEDVNWFTLKFDYRYKDEPWKNSKDAISRSIQKLVGHLNLK